MKIKDEAVADAIRLISEARFAEFRSSMSSDSTGVTLHQHSVCVSGGLLPLIALTEISLRNCVNEALSSYFHSDDWLLTQPPNFSWKGAEDSKIENARREAQRTIYSKLSNREKVALDSLAFPNGVPPALSHDKRIKVRQKLISPTQGKVIAQLTIYFWKRLFSTDYEASLWRPTLKHLFPSKKISRSQVAASLEAIYVIRNRVAHHEVLMPRHLSGVIDAFIFVIKNLRPPSSPQSDAFSQMLGPHVKTLEDRVTAMLEHVKDPK